MQHGATLLTIPNPIDLTTSFVGIFCIVVFALAYVVVTLEERIHLRKSKPVTLAAGIIWVAIAIACANTDLPSDMVSNAVRLYLLEFAELFLFLLVAMSYINTMQERGVFDALRSYLLNRGLGYRQFFWVTGIISFFMSAVADNLTTAMVMCAIILAVGRDTPKFVALACVNVVVAANAGGAFSPFGDITTLMVWQKDKVSFTGFFALFVPSVVNWLIPAVIMYMAVPKYQITAEGGTVRMKKGAKRTIFFFAATIATAVSFHTFLHLPPVLGMMTGLAYLKLFGFYLRRRLEKQAERVRNAQGEDMHKLGEILPFDVFKKIADAEWDTLLFFYGVIMCVGGLGFLGYLHIASELIYKDLGHTPANIIVGVMSAIVDNIPVMVAVLNMDPEMSLGQWLLVTLTAGVGGSLLSVGSAAGVAVMGMARGQYTFMSHLKWMPVIALGYVASIYVHLQMNDHLMDKEPYNVVKAREEAQARALKLGEALPSKPETSH